MLTEQELTAIAAKAVKESGMISKEPAIAMIVAALIIHDGFCKIADSNRALEHSIEKAGEAVQQGLQTQGGAFTNYNHNHTGL